MTFSARSSYIFFMHRLHRRKYEKSKAEVQSIWICDAMEWSAQRCEWKGLHSLILLSKSWEKDGEHHSEKRYDISSLRNN